MRKLLQYLLKRPLSWMGNNLSASPKQEAVFKSLTRLYKSIGKKEKKVKLLQIDPVTDAFIILSDHHKGNRDQADDFQNCEDNYIAALQHYHQQCYSYINLGDSEELWKYKVAEVIPQYTAALQAEAAFQPDDKYFRCFGNHDIIWKNKWDVELLLKSCFHMPLPVYEAIALQATINERKITILVTHGHQGDKMSDNNAVSTWLVAHIWTPIQRYLRINVNTASKDYTLRSKHNRLMYEWSSKKKDLLLITGHTHQPVFASGKYHDHPAGQIQAGNPYSLKPSYFNTGCCCFSDGDITGIEIANGKIALVKWTKENDVPVPKVLEEIALTELVKDL